MKSRRLKLHGMLLITALMKYALASPLFEKAYLQFTEVVCDNMRVGYFCDGAACFSDTDCFSGKCNMYARCEARILFDLANQANEIAMDKEEYLNNKLDKGNATAQTSNQTAPAAASSGARAQTDGKTPQERHFQKSPFKN